MRAQVEQLTCQQHDGNDGNQGDEVLHSLCVKI